MDFQQAREQLVENELKFQGIRDTNVLNALLSVPRELFVPEDLRQFAYVNSPLAIGCGQTISQPLIVGEMTQLLNPTSSDRVLEIGTGSGYAAAVLSVIVREVYTIERYAELANSAQKRLQDLGYRNVHVRVGDGTLGWPEMAPFDSIVVTAGAPQIPAALLQQLKIGGRLVIPVGDSPNSQMLIRAIREGKEQFRYEDIYPVRFVPLIGHAAWSAEDSVDSGRPDHFEIRESGQQSDDR